MLWPDLTQIFQKYPLNGSLKISPLKEEEIPSVISFLRENYPDIVVGQESVHMDSNFLRQETAIIGHEDRSILPLLLKDQDKLVGYIAIEYDERGRQGYGRLMVIDAKYRKSGLGKFILSHILEEIMKEVGAEIVIYTATLSHPYSQMASEQSGYKLVGIIPAFDRDMVKNGEVRRVYEAVYVKVIVPPQAICLPKPENMTPNTARLYQFLFEE